MRADSFKSLKCDCDFQQIAVKIYKYDGKLKGNDCNS